MTEKVEGEVRVASRIVDYLSSGLYETPAACLKELINNAYDADATLVEIFVMPDADVISILDDGRGMSRQEFEDHFSRVSDSTKRLGGGVSKGGRPVIGKIGIGFIAANEICRRLEIHSTQAGSTELLKVTLDFAMMSMSATERIRLDDNGDEDYAKGDYYGVVEETDKDSHYTRLYLQDIKGEARTLLVDSRRAAAGEAIGETLYGLRREEVANRLRNFEGASWDEFDLYSQTVLDISLNIPIAYHDGWAGRHSEELSWFTSKASEEEFCVKYDGVELRKPVMLPTGDAKASLVEVFDLDGTEVGAKAYFMARHGVVRPSELNGVLVRIRGAAVGDFDSDFWGHPASSSAIFKRWMIAEVWADDRLEPAMNIDRRTLRPVDPAYVELQRSIHAWVDTTASRARNELYGVGAAARKEARADAQLGELERVAKDLPPKARQAIGRISESKPARVQSTDTDETTPARDQRYSLSKREISLLTRKYSVAEVLQTISDVALAQLPRRDAERLLEALANRLLGRDR